MTLVDIVFLASIVCVVACSAIYFSVRAKHDDLRIGALLAVAGCVAGLVAGGICFKVGFDRSVLNHDALGQAGSLSYDDLPTHGLVDASWFEDGPVGAQAVKVTDGAYAIRVRMKDGSSTATRGLIRVDGHIQLCDIHGNASCAAILEAVAKRTALDRQIKQQVDRDIARQISEEKAEPARTSVSAAGRAGG